jgi:hypothetical protein
MKAVLRGLVCVMSLQAGAEEIADPWALLPTLPTACYQEDDDFADRAHAVTETLGTEMSRQQEINQELSQQLANIDPMEQQQRMMDFMMRDPQNAQKYMQAVASVGTQASEVMPQVQEEAIALYGERDKLLAEYDAAMKALDDAYNRRTLGLFEQQEKFDQDQAKSSAAVDAFNAGYETLCASWWNDGPFHEWLARHEGLKRRLLEIEGDGDVLVQNYTIFGIDADKYRSTSSLGAAKEQLDAAQQIFSRRNYKPMAKIEFWPGGV